MATQHVERNLLLNLYKENISLVCFFLPLKRDKNVRHLQTSFSTWRPLAFLPVTLSVVSDSLQPRGLYRMAWILQATVLESFSRGSSQPRDQSQVSRTVGGFLTSWATISGLHCKWNSNGKLPNKVTVSSTDNEVNSWYSIQEWNSPLAWICIADNQAR